MKKSLLSIGILLFSALLFNSARVQAQAKTSGTFNINIGVDGGITTTEPDAGVIGGTAGLQYNVSQSFALTLTSGYYDLFEKSYPAPTGILFNIEGGGAVPAIQQAHQGIIPVTIGLKAYLAPHLYFGAEGGMGIETNEGKNKKLLLSPALGYTVGHLDLSARYESFTGQSDSYGFFALQVACSFGRH